MESETTIQLRLYTMQLR